MPLAFDVAEGQDHVAQPRGRTGSPEGTQLTVTPYKRSAVRGGSTKEQRQPEGLPRRGIVWQNADMACKCASLRAAEDSGVCVHPALRTGLLTPLRGASSLRDCWTTQCKSPKAKKIMDVCLHGEKPTRLRLRGVTQGLWAVCGNRFFSMFFLLAVPSRKADGGVAGKCQDAS